MIGKLFRKLLGIGLIVTGVCLIPGAWMFLADPPHGPRELAFLIGLFASAIVGSLVFIGGWLSVTPRSVSMVEEKKDAGSDEFF